ncbi:MAG: tetratricopeptide repeat protein [Cyanobium sp.]|nr:tetratricopeptide repeat protein [Cyanobium sp.]
MPPPKPRQRLWLGLGMAALAAASLSLGWWLGHRQQAPVGRGGSQVASRARQAGLGEEIRRLQQRLQAGDATPGQQQRLLELLVATERRTEATALLEVLADQDPGRWTLRLLLAELRRDQRDPRGAERELRQLLSQRPDQVEALQLRALLQLESGRGAEAQTQLEDAFKRASAPTLKPVALPIGLLLAHVQQQRGQQSQAEAGLLQLAGRFPGDPRPLLARALLQHDQGNRNGAQQTLAEARRRVSDPKLQEQLDRVATAWGGEALKGPGSGQTPAKPAEN